MKTLSTMVIWTLLGSTATCVEDDPQLAIARAHAPKHYQDTDSTSPLSDEITAVDYDGNWFTTDNWDHLADPSVWTSGTEAVVYYSVVETCTHWFVVYAMYHPRDWTDHAFDQEHENDMEGLLVAVTKDGTPHGRVDGAITVAHRDFYSFVPAGSPWTSGAADVDGTLTFEPLEDGPHLATTQEAKGHGLKAWPYAGDFSGAEGEDGITYVPGDLAESPADGNARDVHYMLESVFDEMWLLQLSESAPFASFGTFEGDESGTCGDGVTVTCGENSAHTPWGWDDHDDGGALQAGLLALDPAAIVEDYFDGLGDFSRTYVSNRYLETLRNAGYTNAFRPNGMASAVDLDEMYSHLGACAPTAPTAATGSLSGGSRR